MRSFPKSMAWVCLLAISLLMFGCGGGGSSSSDEMPDTDNGGGTPPPSVTPSVDLGGLSVPAGDYSIDAGMTQDVGEGETEVTLSCSDAADCAFTVDAEGMETATSGEVTAALSDAANQAIADREEEERVAAEEMAAAAAKAEAERVAGMIGPEVTNFADAVADDAGDTATLGDQPIVTLTEEAAATGGNTAVAGVVVFMGDEPATQENANRFVMSGTPATIPGWTGGTYTRTNGNTVHTVVKYNDKKDNGAEDYATYFGVADRPGVSGTAVASDGTTPGQLTLAATTDYKLFSISFGITAPNQNIPASHHDDPDTTGTQHDNPNTEATETSSSWTGMFAGVSGTFTCSGDTCAVTSDAKGNLASLGGSWTFRPAGSGTGGHAEGDELDDIMVEGVVPDADFMIFGYWEQAVTDDEGDTTYSMLPIADGKRDYGAMTTVTGTATYAGPATGLYTKNALTPEGAPTGPYSSGQFTADAMLTANFGGPEVATNHQFSITGTISNFMDDGVMINDQWVVNLNRRMIGTGTAARPQQNVGDPTATGHRDGSVAGDFDGVTDGGTLGSGEGSWSGVFHGPGVGTTNPQPVSASGMFSGHFSNGHVRGAFAANRQAQ